MSACFTRADGKPIDAYVVYRYRLIDSIADGNAKNPASTASPPGARVHLRLVHPDGRRQEIVGRDALLEVLSDERALARITAKSAQPQHRLMTDSKLRHVVTLSVMGNSATPSQMRADSGH